MKILVLASLAWSLVNFRGALLRRLVAEGYEVTACAPDFDPAVIAELAAMGVRYHAMPMDRTGLNPLRDANTLWSITRLLRRERPDIVLAYTQKPIIYGGIASRLARLPIRFFAMVSGLGHVYSEGGGGRRGALRWFVSRLYARAVARAECVFVFNRDDGEEMRRFGIVRDQKVVQLPGSGVDTQRFRAVEVPTGPPVFLLTARLMRSKGIAEFVAAARLVRARFPDARFQILGPIEPGPDGIGREVLDRWKAEGDVVYLGETRDVAPYLAAASVFVLPSYYREGLPRTILEALATGRAIVTTDMPGCRETVDPGWNGLIVPPRDTASLANAMMTLAAEPELIAAMGANSRTLAEARFDVAKVNDAILGEIKRIGSADGRSVPRRRRGLTDVPMLEAVLALAGGILLLPVIALVALAVVLSLGRPLLFFQQRVGRGCEPFTLVKFRTMRQPVTGARAQSDAERVTRIGRLLRRTRLDELPGLWNIVRRDMSLVGPRPILPETIEAMGKAGLERGAVRPGLTGWAQINGNVLLSDADKLSLDLWYIANRSIWFDIAIIARTIPVLLFGERINRGEIVRAYAGAADRRG